MRRKSKSNPAGKPLRSTDLAMLPMSSRAPSYFVDVVDTRYKPPRVLESRVRRTDASATIALARSEKMRFIKLVPHLHLRQNPSEARVAGNLEPYLRGVTIPPGFVPNFSSNDNVPIYWNKSLGVILAIGHHDKLHREKHQENEDRLVVYKVDADGEDADWRHPLLSTSNPRALVAWVRRIAAIQRLKRP